MDIITKFRTLSSTGTTCTFRSYVNLAVHVNLDPRGSTRAADRVECVPSERARARAVRVRT